MNTTSIPQLWGHPKGLFYLFCAELWERFSFYGMRALLVLYMTKQLLFTDEMSFGVYAAYGSLVYMTPLIGGMVADKILGYRKSIMLGGILMAIGHFMLAIEEPIFFYGALGIIIVGNGFFKPNISSFVGTLYDQGDARREAGFTIFYMGINIGGWIAPLLCAWLANAYGWHYGFGAAGIGMLVGLAIFLKGKTDLPGPRTINHRKFTIAVLLTLMSIPLIAFLLYSYTLLRFGSMIAGIVVYGYLIYEAIKLSRVERNRIFVAMVLMFGSMVFWAIFEQAGSSITLFTDRNVNRFIGGREIMSSQFQSINPLFVILLAGLFSRLWPLLSRLGLEPSTPFKFGLGICQVGLGFLVLRLGYPTAVAGKLSIFWLLAMYFLHTTGELSLSPIGLSAMTKLAPKHIVGTVIGAWFLATAYSYQVGAFLAEKTASSPHVSGASEAAVTTLRRYVDSFADQGYYAVGLGLVMIAISPLLKRAMHGVR